MRGFSRASTDTHLHARRRSERVQVTVRRRSQDCVHAHRSWRRGLRPRRSDHRRVLAPRALASAPRTLASAPVTAFARVLILTADIGAGHDLPAELLADAIRERDPRAHVVVVDALQAAGPGARALARNGAEAILERAPWLFDVQYWLIARCGPTRRLGGRLAMALSARGLRAVIAHERPDVIVSTYPGSTEVLGRMRRAGVISVPCLSAITDLAALRWWAHPSIDVHLISHAQSRAEVEAIAGPGADVRHVRRLTRPEFEAPPE